MVSFQCHSCGDVVKKPKLDQHRTQCHGGFDCIDCSTTFNSPAEYKGHTSCISEAEKYQKSLYKGPRTGESAPKNHYPPQPASEPYPGGGGSSWGRGGFRSGRGGRGGFGGRGGWGQPPSRGTGANDTPLGTPNRGSPVIQPAPTPVKQVPQPSVVASSTNDSWQGKKRKYMGTEDALPPNGDVPSDKRAKIAQRADVEHVEPVSVPPTATHGEAELKKEKRSKEKKSTSTDEAGGKEGKKKKKKKKEAAPAEVIDNDSEQAERTSKKEKSKEKGSDKEEKKRKKEKRREDAEAAAVNEDDTQGNSVDSESKKAKSKDREGKKNKKEVGKGDKESDITGDQEGTKESSTKKEKKRKEKKVDEVAVEVPEQVNGVGVNGKEKKRKRDKVEDVVKYDGDVDAGVDTKEMKKKKKKKEKKAIDADSISK